MYKGEACVHAEEAVAARISAGSRLYKFNGFSAFPRPGAGPNEAVSPWWSPYGEFEIQGMGRDTGYGAKVKTAREKGVSLREWARHTSAVKEDWNTLQWVVFIKLRTTIIGYWGGIEAQDRSHLNRQPNEDLRAFFRRCGMEENSGYFSGSTNLPGGVSQFYIPGLTPEHFQVISIQDLVKGTARF